MSSGTLNEKDERCIEAYLAKYSATPQARESEEIYRDLVENHRRFPWAKRHDWKTWRAYYAENKEHIERRVAPVHREQPQVQKNVVHTPKKPAPPPKQTSTTQRRSTRVGFTQDDDEHLVEYMAIENFFPKNRTGKKIFEQLIANENYLWPWAKRHTVQSWRERYKNSQLAFDQRIRRYQRQYRIAEEEVQTAEQRLEMWQIAIDREGADEEEEEEMRRRAEKHCAPPRATLKRPSDDKTDKYARKKRRLETVDKGEQDLIAGPSRLVVKAPGPSTRISDIPHISHLQGAAQEDKGGDAASDESDEEVDQLLSDAEHVNRTKPDEGRASKSPPNARERPGDTPAHGSLPPSDLLTAPDEPHPRTSTPCQGVVSPALSQAIPTPQISKAICDRNEIRGAAQQPKQAPTPPTSDSPVTPAQRAARNAAASAIPVIIESSSSDDSDADVLPKPAARIRSQLGSTGPSQQTAKARKRPTPKRKDSPDIFASDEPVSRSSSPRQRQTRPLPVRAEGALNSALTDKRGLQEVLRRGARRSSMIEFSGDEQGDKKSGDEQAHDNTEPPARRKRSRKEVHRGVQTTGQDAQVPERPQIKPRTVVAEELAQAMTLRPSKQVHHPFSQPTQQPAQSSTQLSGAEAGPSSPKRPQAKTQHHAFSDDEATQRKAELDRPRVIDFDRMPQRPTSSSLATGSDGSRVTTSLNTPEPDVSKHSAVRSIHAHPAPSIRTDNSQSGHPPSKSKGKERGVGVSHPDGPANRRHTVAGTFLRTPVPQSLSSYAGAARSPAKTAMAPAPMYLANVGVVLDPRDHAEVYRTIIERAVLITGWPKEVVYHTWQKTGSWSATVATLTAERVKDKAAKIIDEEIAEQSRRSEQSFGAFDSVEYSAWYPSSRPKTPPTFVSGVPPQSPIYMPPDNSRAAIYLKEFILDSAQKAHKQKAATPGNNNGDKKDSDDESDGNGHSEESGDSAGQMLRAPARSEGLKPPTDQGDSHRPVNSRLQVAKRILGTTRRVQSDMPSSSHHTR